MAAPTNSIFLPQKDKTDVEIYRYTVPQGALIRWVVDQTDFAWNGHILKKIVTKGHDFVYTYITLAERPPAALFVVLDVWPRGCNSYSVECHVQSTFIFVLYFNLQFIGLKWKPFLNRKSRCTRILECSSMWPSNI